MRLTIAIFLAASLAIPAVVTTTSPGFARVKATDISSQKKKKKKTDEENVKTAPSDPPAKGQSTY